MSVRRPLVAIAVVAALVGGAAGCGGRKEAPKAAQDSPQLTGVDPASDEVPATPSPTPSASPTAAIQFPEVQPAIGEKMGEIEIPKIGLVHAVFQGFELKQIDHGPGHWPRSPLPGQAGNVVFAGHRVTHSHPFLDIDQMAAGDLIIFRTPSGEFTYEMTESLIVRPADVHILNPTPEGTVTLFACHPKHSARQRYVVKGRLISSVPAPAPGGEDDDD
jgi:sortase A